MTDTDIQPNLASELVDHDEFGDESWLDTTKPKGVRIRAPFAALTLGIAVAIGIWGGATLVAHRSQPVSATTAAARFGGAGRAAGATGATGAAGATGAVTGNGGGGVSGTVASVNGTQIRLTTSTGSTVTVNLLPSTTIARTASAAATDITAGETITVRGQTGTDGTTTAQAVTIVPATSGG
jgi:hypothetical protein